MWAFLLLVVTIGLIIILPAFLPFQTNTIRQPLILTPDSRTFNMTSSKTITANFTVANLNTTSTITTTATVALTPASPHINATIYGVKTGSDFVLATNGGRVSFLPGGNTLVVRIISDSTATPGNYTLHVSLVG